MDLIPAIVLGIVQGLTEFLPISSSAHLVLVPWVFGWPEPGLSFDVALHIGTLVGVLVYFWREWVRVVGGIWQSISQRSLASFEAKLGWFIVLGTIPGAIAGALGESRVEEFFHSGGNASSPSEVRGAAMIAVALMLMGVVLFLADRVGKRTRGMEKLALSDAMLIGLAQALAIIPGVSRSGSTITMGLFRSLNREAAAHFSFLLGAPVIAGAGLKSAYDLLRTGLAPGEAVFFAVGMLTAAVVGFLAIAFMLRYLQRNSTLVFTLYRLVLGAGILLLVLMRR